DRVNPRLGVGAIDGQAERAGAAVRGVGHDENVLVLICADIRLAAKDARKPRPALVGGIKHVAVVASVDGRAARQESYGLGWSAVVGEQWPAVVGQLCQTDGGGIEDVAGARAAGVAAAVADEVVNAVDGA